MAITIDGADNKLEIGANATGPSSLRLYEDTDNGTNYVSIIAPSAVTSNRTITLPDNTGTILTSATAGSVLQVVSVTYSTQTSISSTSYTDTGLTASITPTSASSKILVIVNQSVANQQNTNAARVFELQLLRGATTIMDKDFYSYAAVGANGYFETGLDGTQIVLDSPATTSSTTYKTQGRMDSTASSTALVFQQGSGESTITLMEIAA
jgi:hypothetical protein